MGRSKIILVLLMACGDGLMGPPETADCSMIEPGQESKIQTCLDENNYAHLAPGHFFLDNIAVTLDHSTLSGSGNWATYLHGTVITVGYAAGVELKDFLLDGSGGEVGTALTLNASELTVSNVSVTNWTGVGLQLNGWDAVTISKVAIKATIPVVIDQYSDHIVFRDSYFIATGNNPVIEIVSQYVSHITFTGYQAWVGGTHGLYWLDLGENAWSSSIMVEHMRWEQPATTDGYAIYVEKGVANALQELGCFHCQWARQSNGLFGRHLRQVTLNNVIHLNDEGISVDLGCKAKLDITSSLLYGEIR